MTRTLRRLSPILFLVSTFLAGGTARAAEDASKKSPYAATDGSYDVGVLGNFMTASPVLAVFYKRYETVAGTTFGGFATTRRANGFRITADLTYTSVSPKDGPWLASGKNTPASEWTEFRTGSARTFSIWSADLLFGHEFSSNGNFGFYVGGGAGLAIPVGTITSYGTTGSAFDQKAVGSAPDKKNIPPVVPTVLFKFGPTVNVANRGTLMLDAGLQNGFFVGVSAGYRL